jgi:hypothetical protein
MVSKDDEVILQHLMGEGAIVTNDQGSDFSYTTNPDGTIRWIYPTQLTKPYFLNFYSISSLRAKLISSVIRLAFFFKQRQFVRSGSFKLNISSDSRLSRVLNKHTYDGFSIFTGTVGENRKAVIEIHNLERTFAFVKIALTEASIKLINNEYQCLEYLSEFEFHNMVVPQLLRKNTGDSIEISNIKPKVFMQDAKVTDTHVFALHELYNKTNTQKRWIEIREICESKKKISNILSNLHKVNGLGKNRVETLANKLFVLIKSLESFNNDNVVTAFSHGDFTPWNMYTSNSTLYVFDWELSKKNMPLMTDLFHFIYQAGIMIKHKKYKNILSDLKIFLQMTAVKELVNSYDIDVNKNYTFYLVHNTVYYLDKYLKQKQLHGQALWQMDVWEESINDLIAKKGVLF